MRRWIITVFTAALLLGGAGSALADPGGKDGECPPTSNNPGGVPPDCGNQHPAKQAQKAIDEAQAVLTDTVLTLAALTDGTLDGMQSSTTYALSTESYFEQQAMTLIDGFQEAALILPPVPPICQGCTPETDALYETLYLAYYETVTSGVDSGQEEVALILPPVPPICQGCTPILDGAFDSLQSELADGTSLTLETFNVTIDAAQGQL